MTLLLAACGGDSSTPQAAAGAARDLAFIANAEDGTVSVLDTQSLAMVATLDVLPDGTGASPGEDPVHAVTQPLVEAAAGLNYAQDLDVAPDGRTLYVSRGHRGDVAAFALPGGELRWRASIPGFRADHMTISADGARLYVSALSDNTVQVVDTASGTIVGTIATGEWPHDNHLSHDGRRLFNASIGNILVPPSLREARPALDPALPAPYVLTIADTGSLQVLQTFAFARGIRPYVLDHAERRLWAQLSLFHGIVEIDLATGAIVRELELPVAEGVTEDDYDFEAPHHGLALSPDGSLLCAAGRASDYVALVATAALQPVAILPVGDAPGWAAGSADGRYCLVANNRDDTISVISWAERREVARLPAGDGPKLIAAARVPAAALPAP